MPALSINQPLTTYRFRTQSGRVTANAEETNRSSRVIVRTTKNTPNFNNPKLRPSDANLPINPFYFKQEKSDALSGSYTYWNYAHPEYNYLYDHSYGVLGTSVTRFSAVATTSNWFTPKELEGVNQKAIQKLLANIKDQKVNLVQMYAERAQTADMFAKTAERIATSFMAIRKGEFKRAATALGLPGLPQRKQKRMNKRYRQSQTSSLSGNWLELQYGWQPLLEDCYGTAELIAQKQEREFVTVSRGSSSLKRKSTWKDTQNLYPTQILSRTDTLSYQVRYGVYYTTLDDTVKTMSQIGLLNPATIAWELLPYSFVVDWFIPFGNYVNSWDATVGLSFKKGYVTTFLRGQHDFILTMNWTHKPSTWEVERGTGAGRYEKIECKRTPLGSFPRLSFPGFKNPVSKAHLANAIALLRQTFKR